MSEATLKLDYQMTVTCQFLIASRFLVGMWVGLVYLGKKDCVRFVLKRTWNPHPLLFIGVSTNVFSERWSRTFPILLGEAAHSEAAQAIWMITLIPFCFGIDLT